MPRRNKNASNPEVPQPRPASNSLDLPDLGAIKAGLQAVPPFSRRGLFKRTAAVGALIALPGVVGFVSPAAAATKPAVLPLGNRKLQPQFGARKPPSGAFSDWPSLDATIGNVQIGRVFYTGGSQTLPPTYDPAGDYDGARGGPQIVSYNVASGNTIPWCESITVPTRLSISHEPENYKFPNGQAFVDHYCTEVDVIRSVGNPLITVGPIAMAYGYRTGGPGFDGSYLPPVTYCDWYGVDVYQQTPNFNLPDFPYWANWYKLVKDRGRPILIPEMGIYAEPNQYSGGSIDPVLQAKRAALIPQYMSYLNGLGNVLSALWWCTPGKAGEPGNYMPSDQASLNALKAVSRPR